VAPPADDEAIRLDHLSFTYAGQTTPALQDVSVRIGRGEMVVIMGATGAGKSTLVKCLNRIVPEFHSGVLTGSVSLFGEPLGQRGVADFAGVVGLVSQDFEAQLFATNVLQEVAFGLEQIGVSAAEMRGRLPRALDLVGLNGFEGRDPTTLSGGEKQRLAIAATIALEPRILVFDEPTTDLDPAGKLEVFSVLAAMRHQGYTLIVIEHETSAAEHADRVLLLHEGRIVADDAPQAVLSRVEFLVRHGVRAPDLYQLAAALHLEPPPNSLDEAEATLRSQLKSSGPSELKIRPVGTDPNSHAGPARTPLVQVERIEFGYEPESRALSDVSLIITQGDFLALIGHNGSGKTTLAKMLNGLLTPRHGRVLLRGRDVHTLPLDQIASECGFVFQNPDHQIFAANVYDEVAFGPRNLGVPRSTLEERVRQALDAVGLTGSEQDDPFLLGKGQRQRLAVASILAMQPSLLVLDEPTTGLDYPEQRHMMDLIAELHRRGMTVVMITHSPWVVTEYASRGVLMHRGQILFDGPLRDLFADEAQMQRAHFRPPDVTRLGRRFGFTPLSVAEFVAAVTEEMSAPRIDALTPDT